jgi:hypothetical protein
LSLTVLITNFQLDDRTGTTLYVQDLALELKRKGHVPIVYTKRFGDVSRDLANAGIAVTRNMRSIRKPPDVIHGHHWHVTDLALKRFPGVPAIYICHDHTAFVDGAAFHPQIGSYFGVSQLCIDRLVSEGVPRSRILPVYNFVDTKRFAARNGLPASPRRALVFSNYAHSGTHLPAVAAACRKVGLTLDVIGKSSGNAVGNPESHLWRYDLVFAKAKAAMEAMATGAAVVLCDFGGVGPMVTSENYEALKRWNFGRQALTAPLNAESVGQQIQHYDPVDARQVCERLRADAGLDDAVERLCQIYRDAIARGPFQPVMSPDARRLRRSRRRSAAYLAWSSFPGGIRSLLGSIPGFRVAKARVSKWINSGPDTHA